jgi:hypothetical protein
VSFPPTIVGLTSLTNAASAQMKGVDLEIQAIPLQRLMISSPRPIEELFEHIEKLYELGVYRETACAELAQT